MGAEIGEEKKRSRGEEKGLERGREGGRSDRAKNRREILFLLLHQSLLRLRFRNSWNMCNGHCSKK